MYVLHPYGGPAWAFTPSSIPDAYGVSLFSAESGEKKGCNVRGCELGGQKRNGSKQEGEGNGGEGG